MWCQYPGRIKMEDGAEGIISREKSIQEEKKQIILDCEF